MAIAAVAGIVRGVTGFGGSMVMTPPLALLFGPRAAIAAVLLLEAFAAAPMIPDAATKANWRLMLPLSLAAFAAIPLGGYVLVHTNPEALRRVIAAVVFVFSLLVLWGARYKGPHGVPSSLALGGLSGALLGATGIGGPPVILYLLSGPDPVHVTRANLTLYVVFISIAGLVMLAGRGLLDSPGMLTALLLAPMFFGGVIAGSWIFKRVSERRFRQVTLVLLVAVSIGIVLA